MNFNEWLFSQIKRRDGVGKLARAMAEFDHSTIRPRRKPDEHKNWADAVTRLGEREHIFAFNEAWQEYESTRETSEPAT